MSTQDDKDNKGNKDDKGGVVETGIVVGLEQEKDVKVIVVETKDGITSKDHVEDDNDKGGDRSARAEDNQQNREVDDPEDRVALDAAKDDAEKEAIRQRRRDERARKKDEARMRDEAKDREIAELRAKVGTIEKNQAQIADREVRTYVDNLDASIDEAKRQMEEARSVRRKALKEQNDEAFDAADEALRGAENAIRDMTQRRTQVVENYRANAERERDQGNQQGKLDPQVAQNARIFAERNKQWYDPRGTNEDSKIAISIDAQVRQEGFDPRTSAYWQEVEKRVAARLPNVRVGPEVQQTQQQQQQRKQTTSGSGRETAGAGSEIAYTLSAARVAALKEAGMWDDPVQRAKMIKRYMSQDKAAAQGRA